MTRRLTEYLWAIESYIQRHGYPPTRRDIAKELGICMTGDGVQGAVRRLVAAGRVEARRGPRALRVTRPLSSDECRSIGKPIIVRECDFIPVTNGVVGAETRAR